MSIPYYGAIATGNYLSASVARVPSIFDEPGGLMDLLERCAKFEAEYDIKLDKEIAFLRERLQAALEIPITQRDGAVTFKGAVRRRTHSRV